MGRGMSNLPMVIKNKDDAPGYVYLVRFNNAKDCFKIGSTGNTYRRMKSFGDKWNDVDLIAYGYASDKNTRKRINAFDGKEFTVKEFAGVVKGKNGEVVFLKGDIGSLIEAKEMGLL